MRSSFKLAAAPALALAAAALFGACRADDTTGGARAGSPPDAARAASKQSPKPMQTPAAPAEDARRVTPEELRTMLEAGGTAVYDTRSKESYDQEHIRGALSMPSNEVGSRAEELPKDKALVFYCT